MASISMGAESSGGPGTTGSWRFSIVSRSVGTQRGGGDCASTVESRHFSIDVD